jgi:hypothetical protein
MKTIWTSCLLVALATATVSAAEQNPAREKKGPLAERPSEPGAQLAQIQALGSNEWVNLGKPKPDPKYGPAQGRSWGRKMAYAPDLRGAFIYGEGVHGGATSRGGKAYYNDDLFFYDINAHAWVCCYPGTPLDKPGLKLDPQTGFETDAEDNVIPVAISVHSYWCPEYDIERKRFMVMPSPATPFWEGRLPIKTHRPHISPRYSNTPCRMPGSPYYFDPVFTGKWERRKTAGGGKSPRCNVDNALFYSRTLKKPVYMYGGTWLYDDTANAWKKVSPRGGGCGAYCHDTKRDRIYTVFGKSERDAKGNWRPVPGSNRLHIYDIAANKWTTPPHKGDAGGGMESSRAFFTYDAANDVAALHIHDRHHIYDPETATWTTLPQTQEAKPNWGASSGFYDPDLNAHFYFNASDSNVNPGNMWVWRYQRAATPEQ